MRRRVVAAVLTAVTGLIVGWAPQAAWARAQAARATGKSRLAFSHALPKLDGGHLVASLVEVTYGPGEGSPVHSHPCPVVGYVLEGDLRVQVQGEAERVYHVGETFYEPPNGVHMVSANANPDRPARLLASFTCDADTPLSVPARPGGGAQ